MIYTMQRHTIYLTYLRTITNKCITHCILAALEAVCLQIIFDVNCATDGVDIEETQGRVHSNQLVTQLTL